MIPPDTRTIEQADALVAQLRGDWRGRLQLSRPRSGALMSPVPGVPSASP
jgi:hypothetical protein